MPDNRLDDKFIDHAWEQMRQLLDQEMPQKEKRRRFIIVPWMWGVAASLLLLISIGLGWWFWQDRETIGTPIAASDAKQAIGVIPEENCDEVTTPAIAELSAGHPTQVQPGKVSSISPKANNSALKRSFEKKPIVIKNSAQIQSVQQLVIADSLLPSTNMEKITKTDHIGIAQNAANAIQQTDYQEIPLISGRMLEVLNHSFANEMSAPEPNLNLITPPIEHKKSKNWSVGVEFATYASTGAPVSGFASGAVMQLPVSNENLSLRTGLNYSNLENMIDPQAGSATEEALKAEQRDQFFTGASVSVAEPDFSMTSHQLNLPLILEYKMHKFFGIEGGVQGSYLVAARNLEGAEAYQVVLTTNYVPPTIQNFVNNFAADTDGKKINIDQLHRWDVMATAGFTIYPIQKLGVRFQYQRGLVDMLRNKEFEAFHNNFRVSAVYFFR